MTSGVIVPPTITILATGDISPHKAFAPSKERCPFIADEGIFYFPNLFCGAYCSFIWFDFIKFEPFTPKETN